MVEYVSGDIIQDTSTALVNPVNCVGVMGKGLAERFKREYPQHFEPYRKACLDGKLVPGKILVHDDLPFRHDPDSERTRWARFIVCFPTKRHWREPSRMEYIRMGMYKLVDVMLRYAIDSIAIPALGCGYGGLQWKDVNPIIYQHMQSLRARVRIYPPVIEQQ